MSKIKELREYYKEIKRLNGINALLGWDQEVNMQDYASLKGRSKQVSLVQKLIHQRLTSEKLGNLLMEAQKMDGLDKVDSAILRETQREYDLATKLPEDLVMEIAETSILAAQKWRKAREKNDFSIFESILEKTVDLQLQQAEKLKPHPDNYSTLIDLYEPGATYDWISDIFNEIRPRLVETVKELNSSSDKPDGSILKKNYNEDKQFELSFEIIKKLNFDLEMGRQDRSTHPFTTSISSGDVRITTRTTEDYLNECIFGTIHECGHALYEMGVKEDLYETILAEGTSMGIHESQSRMWENFVGRSKEFWMYWYPTFQKYFPDTLKDYPLEEFYRVINIVEPSFIRVNADEVTYGLHIILRFELERDLIHGKIDISELPELWNTKFDDLLGIVPPTDTVGVLQDIHWSMGAIGYFPTYFLGNLYAAQFYNHILNKIPSLPEQFKNGEFSNLLSFLRENIHQYGRMYRARDLVKRVTGEDLNPQYFLDYVKRKFYPIYRI
ncbi:MAG: carboxypeptidase M32 [Promethearchaeota archaeon]|nr:MAG: carboxypeptidase M32 [Candidatus Lokiarchaeota archaeon]